MAEATGAISTVLRKAKLLELFNRQKAAEEHYRSLIDKYPSDFRAYFNLAQLLLQHEDRKNASVALNLFKRVVELSPSTVEAYGLIAALYIKERKPADAEAYCMKGLMINNRDSTCLFNVNVALRQLDRMQDAVRLTWSCLTCTQSTRCTDRIVHDAAEETHSHHSISLFSQQLLTLYVVCVKWGTKYGSEYVNKLFSAVMRHTEASPEGSLIKIHFICITDDSTGINNCVECLPLSQRDERTNRWHSWWVKTHIFSPTLLENRAPGWMLYIDLDTIVCDSLRFLLDAPSMVLKLQQMHKPQHQQPQRDISLDKTRKNKEFDTDSKYQQNELPLWAHYYVQQTTELLFVLDAGCFENEARPRGINSSIMLWKTGSHRFLYETLLENFSEITQAIYKFDHYMEMMLFDKIQFERPALSCCDYAAGSNANNSLKASHSLGKTCFFLQDFFPGRIIDYSLVACCSDPMNENSVAQSTEALPKPPPPVDSYIANIDCLMSSPPELSASIGALEQVDCARVAIVCFPLKPKPHELVSLGGVSWLMKHWK